MGNSQSDQAGLMGNSQSDQADQAEKGDLAKVEHVNRSPSTMDEKDRRSNPKPSPPSIEAVLSNLQNGLASDLAGLDSVSFGMDAPSRGRALTRTTSRRQSSAKGGVKEDRGTESMAFQIAGLQGKVGALEEILTKGKGTARPTSETRRGKGGGAAEIKESLSQRFNKTVASFVPHGDSFGSRIMLYVLVYLVVELTLVGLWGLGRNTYPVCSRTLALSAPLIAEPIVYYVNDKTKTPRQRREKAAHIIIPYVTFMALFVIVVLNNIANYYTEIAEFSAKTNASIYKAREVLSTPPGPEKRPYNPIHIVDTHKVPENVGECMTVLDRLIKTDLNNGARFSVQAYCSLQAEGNKIIKKMCGLFTDTCMQYALEHSFTTTMNSIFTVFDDARSSTLISSMQAASNRHSIFVDGFRLGAFKTESEFRIIVDTNTLRLFHLLRFLGLPSVCPSSSTEESCYKADVEADITERLRSVVSITEGKPLYIAHSILNRMFGEGINMSHEVAQQILDGTYDPHAAASPGLKALCAYMNKPKSVAPIESISSVRYNMNDLNAFDSILPKK